jgi:eukaryotic-like serine/threonine-protein kinase
MSARRILFASCLVVTLSARLAWAEPPAPKDGPLGMKFVPLPKATFYLGWNGEPGSARKTEIKEGFEIAIHTVTQGQWRAVMGNNPSWFSREGGGKGGVKDVKDEDLKHFPVETVSWHDTQEFIKKLNEKERNSGYVYRLPSEAEWEYACRGGATSEEECSYHFYFAKPTNDLSPKQANFNGNVEGGNAAPGTYLYLTRTTKVGSYPPNKLGLCDMQGNVCQWCADCSQGGAARGFRGGCWFYYDSRCRATHREWLAPTGQDFYLGFRLARVSRPVPGQ